MRWGGEGKLSDIRYQISVIRFGEKKRRGEERKLGGVGS